jgi:hypothetical protein
MEILEIIIFIIGILFSASWMYGIRTNIKRGDGVAKGTVNITMLFIFSLAIARVGRISLRNPPYEKSFFRRNTIRY